MPRGSLDLRGEKGRRARAIRAAGSGLPPVVVDHVQLLDARHHARQVGAVVGVAVHQAALGVSEKELGGILQGAKKRLVIVQCSAQDRHPGFVAIFGARPCTIASRDAGSLSKPTERNCCRAVSYSNAIAPEKVPGGIREHQRDPVHLTVSRVPTMTPEQTCSFSNRIREERSGESFRMSQVASVIWFYSTREIPYGAFSNFAKYPVTIAGESYATTEHYFQAQKPDLRSVEGKDASVKIAAAKSASEAAQLGAAARCSGCGATGMRSRTT